MGIFWKIGYCHNATGMKILASFSSAIQTHPRLFEPSRPNRVEFHIFLIPNLTYPDNFWVRIVSEGESGFVRNCKLWLVWTQYVFAMPSTHWKAIANESNQIFFVLKQMNHFFLNGKSGNRTNDKFVDLLHKYTEWTHVYFILV